VAWQTVLPTKAAHRREPKARKEDMAIEYGNLMGSDKVDGAAVYGVDTKRIGSIKRVMINKTSGEVAYAVLSFGGLPGVGGHFYLVPWKSLVYEINLGGYVAEVTEDKLKGAPSYSSENSWDWAAPGATKSIDDYYMSIP
jgi:hypothetical protein